MKVEDVTIIGAGPAGIATAIQLKRSGIEPVLMERNRVGGLLVNANLVENYPGFPEGISGHDLVKRFHDQLTVIGVSIRYEEVRELDYDGELFTVRSSKGTCKSRLVVIASGTRPRQISISIEAPDRVLYEVASIADTRGEHVAIVGAGDAAFDYALNLSRQNHVTILNRGQERKCLPLLWERTQRNERIAYRTDVQVKAVTNASDGVLLTCQTPQGGWELSVDYVIFAIGRIVQLDYLSQRLQGKASELGENGLLYFVGDAKNDIFRQTSIAVGDGVRAALKIHQQLQGTSECRY